MIDSECRAAFNQAWKSPLKPSSASCECEILPADCPGAISNRWTRGRRVEAGKGAIIPDLPLGKNTEGE
jgi:hypothetical protein